MTVKERLDDLRANAFVVNHIALGEEQLFESDWIRVKSNESDEFLFADDRQFVNRIPNDLLDKTVCKEEVWYIGGGYLTLDLFV